MFMSSYSRTDMGMRCVDSCPMHNLPDIRCSLMIIHMLVSAPVIIMDMKPLYPVSVSI